MRPAEACVAITGAAGGIGRALCDRFAKEGAALALVDRRGAVLELREELADAGTRCAAAVVDIADDRAVARAFSTLRERLGPTDVLINNAGFSSRATIADTSTEDWADHLAGNLNGAFHCSKAVLADMTERKSGAIVMIASVNGLSALGDPAYSAAKSGMISLTRSLAQEYGPLGVRVNAVLPGTVRTPIWDERVRRDPAVLSRLERWYPLGRIAEPEEVAAAVAFLASPEAGAITGAAIPVDCGLTSGNRVMAQELIVEEF